MYKPVENVAGKQEVCLFNDNGLSTFVLRLFFRAVLSAAFKCQLCHDLCKKNEFYKNLESNLVCFFAVGVFFFIFYNQLN